jgi:undecaprenyl-diphosphatase
MIASIRALDEWACAPVNRINRRHRWGRVFALASRLGDGWAWYALAAVLLAWDGAAAAPAVVAMALCGAGGSLIYRWIKSCTRRTRPCHARAGLVLTVAPLDQFSFPSGHTLHAVAFACVATAYAPILALVVWPFTVLVAGSRLVLGLHWPSDVAAGALIGGISAWLALGGLAWAGWPVG